MSPFRPPRPWLMSLFLPVLALAAACTSACASRLEARATEAHPVSRAQNASATLFIYTKNGQLPDSFRLANAAQFTAFDADRARFEVRLVHTWEEWADSRGWEIWLEDEAGQRIAPAARQGGPVRRVAMRWLPRTYEPLPGTEHATDETTRQSDRVLGGWDVYQSETTLDFAAPGLLASSRRGFTLVARRDDLEMRWEWTFADGPTRLEHHGRSKASEAVTVVIPGPETEIAGE